MIQIHEKCVFSDSKKIDTFVREGLEKIIFSSESGKAWCYQCDESYENMRIGYFSSNNMLNDNCDIHERKEEYMPV